MTGIEKTDMLLWMDVETTGLDPDHDRILEVELRCTDMKGVLCVGGFHRVIGLAERNVSITDENFKAWRMHCANGLLEDALDGGYTEEATAPTAPAHASTATSANTRASSATWPPIRSDTSPRKQQGDEHLGSDPPMRRHPDRLNGQQAMNRTKPTMKGTSE